MSNRKTIAFLASSHTEAQDARDALRSAYAHVDAVPEDADVIVALGGDGFMLQCLHRFMDVGTPIFGMHAGSVGFLMNRFGLDDLEARIARARTSILRPLEMVAQDTHGVTHTALAINEVSLLRQTAQAAKLAISVDGRERMPELICDGALVATPAGSTAYNLSAHGPILPIDASLLALTPISAFRPRRWRGALLPDTAEVTIEALETSKRAISAVADHAEFRDVVNVTIRQKKSIDLVMLFDDDHSLDERVLAEQFAP